MIKLKDILIEGNMIRDDIDTKSANVQFVTPPAHVSYANAASDGAGKPYTQKNIDFSGLGDDNALVQKAADVIKTFENNKDYKKGGFNKQTQKWSPHASIEGGSNTIAYGHKIQPNEKFDQGLSDEEAIELLRKDVKDKIKVAKDKIKNFNALPLNVKIATINALFRGDMGPKTMELLGQSKFDEAATEYLNHREYRTTSNSGVKKRMEWNYKVFKSAN
jgi:hypothetical protein